MGDKDQRGEPTIFTDDTIDQKVDTTRSTAQQVNNVENKRDFVLLALGNGAMYQAAAG